MTSPHFACRYLSGQRNASSPLARSTGTIAKPLHDETMSRATCADGAFALSSEHLTVLARLAKSIGPDKPRRLRKPRSCTDKLEYAQCDGKLGSFCCANPEMCGDENMLEDGLCEDLLRVEGASVDRNDWCEANPALCCDNDVEVEIEGSTGGSDGPGF